MKPHVKHETFRSGFKSWEQLFGEAADFASDLSKEQLISISHSQGKGDGVVTVWYWSS